MLKRSGIVGCAAAILLAVGAANAGPPAFAPAIQLQAGGCPQMRLLNSSPSHGQAAQAALVEACAVLGSPNFRAGVEARSWHAGCPRFPWSSQQSVQGREAYQAMAALPDFTLVVAKVGGRSTIASTDVATSTITIMPARFEGWLTGGDQNQADLVNTLVHEMTHLVPKEGAPTRFRFTDSGHWTLWCDAEHLVSYGLGDLAETVWLSSRSDPSALGTAARSPGRR